MSLELIPLEHVPPTYRIYAALFIDVHNAGFLQSQLLARNPDFEYAFLDASVAISRIHVLAATFRAMVGHLAEVGGKGGVKGGVKAEGGGNGEGGLKTPNVHSEIVLAMSASNNISEAYKKFGIGPTTTSIIVLKVVFPTSTRPTPPTGEDIWNHLLSHVKGTPVPFVDENIHPQTDWSKVHKMYKINGPMLARVDALPDEERRKEKEVLALGGMALRGT